MILTRVRDCRVKLIICKTPHKINCSNQSPENDEKAVCRSPYHKRYYAENREQILTQQKRYRTENSEILKTRRKRWYETTRNGSSGTRAREQKNKDHVSNYQKGYCKNNRARLNEYRRGYYARIRNGSGKDFVSKDKEK